MLQSVNFPLCGDILVEYGGASGLRQELQALKLDGVEGIWGGTDVPADFSKDLLTGYHLTFFPDWLDFYRDDKGALEEKFGSPDAAYRFYGGRGPETLLALYREDLARARGLGARYVVFHVSDVSIEECYTYRWLHTDEEVIDASVEIINLLLKDMPPDFDFLVENQWWPGLTFTEPEKTARLLDGISYARKGILLDTGHLMNTNPRIASQAEGIAYIREMLRRHGDMGRMIRGVHLHQSVSGRYVRGHTGTLPPLPEDYVQRFTASYLHILQIDRHRPWTNPAVSALLEEIDPLYVTHELSARTRQERFRAVRRQTKTLERGRSDDGTGNTAD